MKTRVQQWGNSLALRIPKSFAAEAGLRPNAAVELSLKSPCVNSQLEITQRSAYVFVGCVCGGSNELPP